MSEREKEVVGSIEPGASSTGWFMEGVKDLKAIKDIVSVGFANVGGKSVITDFRLEWSDGCYRATPGEILCKIVHSSGMAIEVPVATVYHIRKLHMEGMKAGSIFNDESLADVLEIVAKYLPEEIPFRGKRAALEVDCGEVVGLESVASCEEMLVRGIVTEQDLRALAIFTPDIVALNLEAMPIKTQIAISSCNDYLAGDVRLGIRGGTIVPLFLAEKQPTSKVFLVIERKHGLDGCKHNSLLTMTCGRRLERLPTDEEFFRRAARAGTSMVDLWRRNQAGELLSLEEAHLLADWKRVQEYWLNNGFCVSQEEFDRFSSAQRMLT